MKALWPALSLVSILISCNNGGDGNDVVITPTDNIPAPVNLNFTVAQVYPHDTAAFTEGLIFYKDQLYEGTGLKQQSYLRRVGLQSGKVLQQVKLSDSLFGEGVTILKDTIYQLTWEEQKVLVYDMQMKLIKMLRWPSEGWGITNNGRELILSNGTDKIYFVRPSDFSILRKISVSDNLGPVNRINELEFINGFIYANRWGYNYILKINPDSGRVIARMNLEDLLSKYGGVATNAQDLDETGAYLNGIACDSIGRRLFVTGKRWPKLFELKGDF